ncbi:deoxynucleoside kinase [Candidatus Woesearchaeota archaeon]|nr:deoxynucleoside kinase [Candidatus Woesearchaeota archaeon]
MKGKLIVIDGPDGSGKGTQTELLIKKLKQEGYAVKKYDFPRYGKKSAYLVEQYLNGKYGKADEVLPKVASLFYAIDRFAAKKDMVKTLKDRKIIISNRYVSANAGHQGGKINDKKQRQEFLKWLDELEYKTLKLPRPDLNIYLHVPWEIGQKLVDKKGHREYIGNKRDIHEADSEHLKNTQEAFSHLIQIEPNWVKIDCVKNNVLLTIEEIHKLVLKEVKKHI